MKAGNEIKKGWTIDICPKCGTAWGWAPGMEPETATREYCAACGPPKELSNAEFCKAVRNRIMDTVWNVQGERENYHILMVPKLLARLEKAEKRMKTMIEAPSYFPPGAIYDPATAADVSVNVSIKRCPDCCNRGWTPGGIRPPCSRCNSTGYVVVGKGET